jgi:hypothetical protein
MMKHGHEHAAWAWKWTCSMEIYIRKCTIDMDMRHLEYRYMQSGHDIGTNMDIDYYCTGI